MKRRRDFLNAARHGRKCAMPGLVLQARARRAGETAGDDVRIGFTVSRKVGNAVERNRVRRRLRAVVEEFAGAGLRRGYDFVVIGRQAALGRPYAALVRDLARALEKLDGLAGARP